MAGSVFYPMSLGARCGVRSGASKRALALLAAAILSIALVVIVVFAGLSFVSVVDHRALREAGRDVVSPSAPAEGAARVTILDDWFGERQGTTVTIGATDVSPDLPGVGTLTVGECAVSPSLKEYLRREPSAAGRFCAGTAVVIDHRGLADPGELLGYRVVEPELVAFGQPIARFGPTPGSLSEAAARRGAAEGRAFTVGIALLPLQVLVLLACIRTSARQRDRRVGALRMLGASSVQVGTMLAAEVCVIGLPGVGLGWLIHRVVVAQIGDAGLGGSAWFESDATVGIGGLVVAVVVLLLSAALAILGSFAAVRKPTAARSGVSSARFRRWPLAVQGVLICAWIVQMVGRSPVGAEETRPRLLLAAATMVVQLCFLPAFVICVARIAGDAMARRSNTVSGLLGGRSVGANPATCRHAAGVCVAAVLLASAAFYGIALVSSAQRVAVEPREALPFERSLAVGNAAPGLADRLGRIRGVERVLSLVPLGVRPDSQRKATSTTVPPSSALIGPCRDFVWLMGLADRLCERSTSLVLQSAESSRLAVGASFELGGSRLGDPLCRFVVPDAAVAIHSRPDGATPVSPPRFWSTDSSCLGPAQAGRDLQVVLRADAHHPAVEQAVRSEVDRFAPSVTVESPTSLAFSVNASLREYLAIVNVLALGSALLLVALVVVGVIDNSRVRRFSMARLAMADVDRRVRMTASLAETALLASVVVAGAALVAALSDLTLIHILPAFGSSPAWAASAGIIAVSVLLPLLTFAASGIGAAWSPASYSLERSE